MKEKTLKKILLKLLLFLSPFILLVFIFLYKDPFKVIKTYKEYNSKPLVLNQSYVCWQNYLNHRDSINYNSFILGNSCCMGFKVKDWEKYLGSDRAVVLMGNGEALYSVLAKLKQLEKDKVEIKNVLLVMDYGLLKCVTKPVKHTFVLHPEVSGESKIKFVSRFLQAFFYPKILIPYIDYSLFGTYRPYMRGIIGSAKITRNPITNDLYNPRDIEIKKDSANYWIKHKSSFTRKTPREELSVVGNKQVEQLKEINAIFKRNNTHYSIVINPSYQELLFNRNDLKTLNGIFGEENVFDYSGTNTYSTNNKYFYECVHFRPLLGRIILDDIYNDSSIEEI
ncbi:histidine kinase [Marinilabiliaceae bacterium JC040]|nr:histidine kinase [Marinilabiliaceae bacterium JC040]